MKEWSRNWNSSKNRRKQRKFRHTAPKHVRVKLLSASLSKDLREKIGKKALPLRTKDQVKIMRGEFKGMSGEVAEIDRIRYKIYVNGVQTKKSDGSEVKVAIDPSNVRITSLHMEDDKRLKRIKMSQKTKDALKPDKQTKAPKTKEPAEDQEEKSEKTAAKKVKSESTKTKEKAKTEKKSEKKEVKK